MIGHPARLFKETVIKTVLAVLVLGVASVACATSRAEPLPTATPTQTSAATAMVTAPATPTDTPEPIATPTAEPLMSQVLPAA